MNEANLEKMSRKIMKKSKTSDYIVIYREMKQNCSRAKDRCLNEKFAENKRLENIDSQGN